MLLVARYGAALAVQSVQNGCTIYTAFAYDAPMSKINTLLLAALLCASPLIAGAQVFKCADSTGKIQFSDQPCAVGQKSSEVRIDKHPEPVRPVAAAPRMSKEAVEHEKERARRKQQSDASHKAVDDASAEVRKIKDENQDPQKCKAARLRVAIMEKDDLIKFSGNTDYFMAKQSVSLYCGN